MTRTTLERADEISGRLTTRSTGPLARIRARPVNVSVRQTATAMTGIDQSLGYVCCFCGRGVADEAPREMVLRLPEDASQQLYCHEACLRGVLHPSVPLGL